MGSYRLQWHWVCLVSLEICSQFLQNVLPVVYQEFTNNFFSRLVSSSYWKMFSTVRRKIQYLNRKSKISFLELFNFISITEWREISEREGYNLDLLNIIFFFTLLAISELYWSYSSLSPAFIGFSVFSSHKSTPLQYLTEL